MGRWGQRGSMWVKRRLISFCARLSAQRGVKGRKQLICLPHHYDAGHLSMHLPHHRCPHWITCPDINRHAHAPSSVHLPVVDMPVVDMPLLICPSAVNTPMSIRSCAVDTPVWYQYAWPLSTCLSAVNTPVLICLCWYACLLSIHMAPVNMPALPSIHPSYCWYIPHCWYSCPLSIHPSHCCCCDPWCWRWPGRGYECPHPSPRGGASKGPGWRPVMLAGWMMHWGLQLRWRWWSQLAWLDPKWVFTMGLTEWRWGLEVEGGGGNEERWCGSFQLDRHTSD